jgi:hypothetical protein
MKHIVIYSCIRGFLNMDTMWRRRVDAIKETSVRVKSRIRRGADKSLKVESWKSKKLKVEGLKVAFDGKSCPCVLAKTRSCGEISASGLFCAHKK